MSSAVGKKVDAAIELGLDGVDQWDALKRGGSMRIRDGPRMEILHDIDPLYQSSPGRPAGNAALRLFKYTSP